MSLQDLASAAGLSAEDRDLLAVLLAEEGVELAAAAAIGRRELPPGVEPPLSFAQERLWFIDRLQPGNPAYNMPAALRLLGALDLPALAATLGELARRHESLRTTFAERDGQPFQVIHPAAGLPLPLVDLAAVAPAAREAAARRLAAAAARRPFDLAAGPLARATAIRLGEAEHLLLLSLHHIVSDGWSTGVLVRELGALYGAFAERRPSPLPPLPIQYADFALWQREHLAGERLAAELAYWRQALAGLATPEVPADRPRRGIASSRGAAHVQVLPPEVAGGIAALGRAHGATLFMTLLAALAAFLARTTGAEDLAVGSPVANRDRPEIEGLIGFFVNTLVLRVDAAGDPGFRLLLARAREASLAAFAHQELPFEKIVEELQPGRDLGRTPFFQVMFSVQSAGSPRLALAGLTLEPVEAEPGGAKFDLTVTATESERGLAVAWSYDRDLFAAATVERLAGDLAAVVTALAVDPGALDLPLSALPFLSTPEALQVARGGERHPAAGGRRLARATMAAEEYVAPRTPTEELLAGIYAELLGCERVGAEDDFFALGGHSLLATRLASRLRQVLEVELPLASLFEQPTVAALAREVDALRLGASAEASGTPGAEPPAPLPELATAAGVPLSFAQERLWFIDHLAPGGAAYNIPAAFRMEGALDAGALAGALAEIVRRHAALRTTFRLADGEPLQVVAPARGLALPRVELGGVDPERRDAEARRLAIAEAAQPFDLARGPLFRVTLLHLEDGLHALLFTLHHIAADGWSVGVLVRELGALYGAFAAGRPSPLPPLPLQYADFAAWQRRRLTGERLAAEVDHWRRALDGLPPLDLPTDRPRRPVQTTRGAMHAFRLPADLAAAVQRLGQARGATPFMVLLAAAAALLARWTGQEDFALGAPIAGRGRAEVEGLIGFFVNTLVLRVDTAGDPSFSGLVERVRRTALAAYDHQELPFEKVVEELQPVRDPSRTPLFQVMVSFQSAAPAAGEGEQALPGLALSPLDVPASTAKFDLTLAFTATPRGLAATWTYNRDLFDGATVARMAACFEVLVTGALAAPDAPLSDLPLLTPEERERVVVAWNRTGREAPLETPVHFLVEEQAARQPRALAVAAEGRSLTYAELDAHAGRLARRLRALGVGPEVPVALCAERSPAAIVGLFAILKAGGLYVPLDPAYPAERLAFVLEDLGRPLLLAEERAAARLPAWAQWMPLEAALAEVDMAPAGAGGTEPLPRVTLPGHGAYMIYTSGSTGGPKGVVVEHRSLANLVAWHCAAYGAAPADRSSMLAGPAFDVAVWELWCCLASGGSLHIPDPALRTMPAELVLEETWPQPLALRALLAGGDRLHRGNRADVPFRLYDNYGPTECTVVSIFAEVPVAGAGPLTIGRPVPNARIYLLDRAGRPVPVGARGEIHIGGAGVARGYFGRPGLTAERFVPDPFAPGSGGRLYRTGDLARYLPNGDVVFLGRLDDQVKVRGHRIELGDIELAAAAHPAVREAAVVLREDRPGEAQLVAYAVPQAGAALAPAELREWLKRRLPQPMVPAAVVVLPALPLTPNGKVDRRRLPAPERRGEEGYVAPRNPMEELLADIWSELLGVERVGVEDNFFELSGHSLQGIRMMTRVKDTFGVELPVGVLFEAPKLGEFAQRVAEEMVRALAAAPEAPLAPLTPEDEPR